MLSVWVAGAAPTFHRGCEESAAGLTSTTIYPKRLSMDEIDMKMGLIHLEVSASGLVPIGLSPLIHLGSDSSCLPVMGTDFSALRLESGFVHGSICFRARSMESCHLTASSKAEATAMRFGLSGRAAGSKFSCGPQ